MFNTIKLTLKKRILFLVVVSTVFSFACVSILSYYSISSILENQISDNIRVNTKQIKISIDNSIKNLTYVSQQLSFHGTVGELIYAFVREDNQFKKSQLLKDVRENLSIISYTNPDIGFRTYYFGNQDEYRFNELSMKKGMSIWDLPLIASYYKISYYGPHISISQNSNSYVLSTIRQVDIPDNDDIYVYIETNFRITQEMLESTNLIASTHTLFLDNDNKVVYSELPDIFETGYVFEIDNIIAEDKEGILSGEKNGYYWFESTSNQGWSVVSVILKSDYNIERTDWMKNIIIAFLVVLIVSLILGLSLWKLIYGPMKKFQQEIKLVSDNRFDDTEHNINIPEFDKILAQFQEMKRQIKKLIDEIAKDEKLRADLEIEKLRNQINPHFLMNTLNTVHWMAIMENQLEIDRIVLSLNRLLSYNLNKNGIVATLSDEINAIKDYLTIQKVRYSFTFRINVDIIDSDKILLPQFIIQPLVENCLFHGLKSGGDIQVNISMEDKLVICVQDNGVGMSENIKENFLHNKAMDNKKIGMGIGIDYVLATLHSLYNGKEEFNIISAENLGTSIIIKIPIVLKEDKDESISS